LHKYFSKKLAPENRNTIESFVVRDIKLDELQLSVHWRIYVRRKLVDKTKALENVAEIVREGKCEAKALEDILEMR